jgi:cytidylate kinase
MAAMIVAIDGPAGAGKSTVARALAERLGFAHLDTGAMYRAVTWLALELGVDVDDGTSIGALAAEYGVFFEDGRVRIGSHDVTAAIREPRIDRAVSAVARHPQVRKVMRVRQRELAHAGDAVVEGRDIGTVVCPDAEVKVFLVAEAAERARRRRGDQPDGDPDDLQRRDARDSAHTRRAADAVELDTTHLTVAEVVDRIARLVREKEVA